jgi:16S rRNA (uracil1498-N3)-methyltransferase
MQRFFLDAQLWQEEIILNDEEIFFQLTKVLRSKVWDKIIFFDWKVYIDFVYKILSIDKKNIIFSLENKIKKESEDLSLNLYQSIPNKIDKIELILQKWVEVWYKSFYFFRSERSQDLRLSDNKIERFKKIVIEAVEQSWRNVIPEIFFLDKLDFKNIFWEKLYFHTESENSKKLRELEIKRDCINIFVWPEWGFSEKEVKSFEENWLIKVNLWNNILRTETAWMVVWFYFVQK